jgi:hypothetical protein
LCRRLGFRAGRGHHPGDRRGPGRQHGRQAAGCHAHRGHHLLQRFCEVRIGGQRRHLVLPEIDVAACQIFQLLRAWLAMIVRNALARLPCGLLLRPDAAEYSPRPLALASAAKPRKPAARLGFPAISRLDVDSP